MSEAATNEWVSEAKIIEAEKVRQRVGEPASQRFVRRLGWSPEVHEEMQP